MKKIIENVLLIISVLLFVWIIASFIDVNMHNLNGGCDTWWNFFVILFAE